MNLELYKKEQIALSKKVILKDTIDLEKVRFVAGVDLTYLDIWKRSTVGISCAVVVDIKNDFDVVEVEYAKKQVDFPYVPTFLAYRELPLVLEVYRKIGLSIDVFMLDGMGIMHPRRMGIASHFGVVTDRVSVGCAKSYLTGEYKEPKNKKLSFEEVSIDGEVIGYALRSKINTKPIFISPGNKISCSGALEVAMMCLNGYRIPEPTRLAHNYLQIYRKKLLK